MYPVDFSVTASIVRTYSMTKCEKRGGTAEGTRAWEQRFHGDESLSILLNWS